MLLIFVLVSVHIKHRSGWEQNSVDNPASSSVPGCLSSVLPLPISGQCRDASELIQISNAVL